MNSRTTYDQMMQNVFNTAGASSNYCDPAWEKNNWVEKSVLRENYCEGDCKIKAKFKTNGSAGCGVVDVPCLSQPWSFVRSPFDQHYLKEFSG